MSRSKPPDLTREFAPGDEVKFLTAFGKAFRKGTLLRPSTGCSWWVEDSEGGQFDVHCERLFFAEEKK